VQSLNIPFVLLLRSFGLDRFYSLLRRLGMTTLARSAQEYGLPLIIGGAEGTLEELTAMYAGLVRCAKRGEEPGGESSFSRIRFFADSDRRTNAQAGEPLSPAAAWLTLSALLDVVRPGEEGAWREFLSSKNIAWKTGTSYGFRDAWAIGVTAKYAIGVWVGNAGGEGRPELRGAHVAAPILFDVFSGLPDTGWIKRPEKGWKLARVCAKSGYPAGPSCAGGKDVYVPESSVVRGICPFCRIVNLDRTGRWQVTSDCEEVSKMKSESWFVLTPAMEWFYRKSNAGYKPLPQYMAGCKDDKGSKVMNILYPEQGASLYIPVEIDGKPGKTVCQAVHRDQAAVIYWHLDGMYFGETSAFHQIEFRIGEGKHTITLVDNSGNMIERSFVILSGK
jgi:penicillin-binding protein 1C